MTTHIALLRGVNVGGRQMVAMAELRDLLTELGFANVRSLLQSGNLVFKSKARTGEKLESFLEAAVEKRLGCRTDFFVRTAEEWEEVVARNPFRAEAKQDPGHLIVEFLKQAPEAKVVAALQAAITGRETIRAVGRQAYIVYPGGVGRSRLTHVLVERKLGTRGTGRNWNTVMKLGALARV